MESMTTIDEANRGNELGIVDFRDEFYVKLYRGWVVISVLCENSKFKAGVPIKKAALVDFLLCNPSIQQRFLLSFGKAQQRLNLDDFLYQNNIEFGTLQDTRDFAKTCSLLIKAKLFSFAKLDGEVMLQATQRAEIEISPLARRWNQEIEHLLPLMGKSLNVLHNSILKVSNGN